MNWLRLTCALMFALIAASRAQPIQYTFTGVFTAISVGTPPVAVGETFSATFTYHLPGEELRIGNGLSSFSFAGGSSANALMGSTSLAAPNAQLYLWEPPASMDTVHMEASHGGRTIRVVLSSSDPQAVDSHVIPSELDLLQFDLKREFQFFGGFSIVGQIENVSVVIIPEPSGVAMLVMGTIIMGARRFRADR
jgi:hypothetical protein